MFKYNEIKKFQLLLYCLCVLTCVTPLLSSNELNSPTQSVPLDNTDTTYHNLSKEDPSEHAIDEKTAITQEQKHESQSWQIIGKLDFGQTSKSNYILEETDPGIRWSVEGGKGRYHGISSDMIWKGNRVFYPFEGDHNSMLEISGEFKINPNNGIYLISMTTFPFVKYPFVFNKTGGDQVIGLWSFTDNGKSGFSPLCMFFEGLNGYGSFHIQTRWLRHKYDLEFGSKSSPPLNVNKGVHSMKIVLYRNSSVASYYYDNILLGEIKIHGEIEPIIKIMMDIETPEYGVNTDLYFDNMQVRSNGNLYDNQDDNIVLSK